MSTGPVTIVEYLEPVVEAEALPDEFSPSSLRRSLLILGAIVAGRGRADRAACPGWARCASASPARSPAWIAFAAVLQLGSCAGYVLVFRGVFCRRMSWRTSTEIGLVGARRQLRALGRRRRRPRARRLDPAPRRPADRLHRAADRRVLPAHEPGQRRLPRARRHRPRHRPAARLAEHRARSHPRDRRRGRRSRWRSAARSLAGATRAALDARPGRRRGRGGRRRRRRGARPAAGARPGRSCSAPPPTCCSTSPCSASASRRSATTSRRPACCWSPTSSGSSAA